jgi:6-phosphogluconolactonase
MFNGFIGTYTEAPVGRAKGVYSFSLNPENGAVEQLALAAEAANPSYLALSPSKKHLYAVNETTGGDVSAYALSDGQLRFINKQPSQGASPCHVALDKNATYTFVANYASGTLAVFPIKADGALGEASQVIQFDWKDRKAPPQEASHAHSFTFDASGEYGFSCDLGASRIMAYRFAPDAAPLQAPRTPPAAPLSPLQWHCSYAGSGPRHMVFHPQGKAAYVVNELHSTIDTLTYFDAGRFDLRQKVSSLPRGVPVTGSSAAAIKLSPDARFLYASNRGHDSIAVYRVNRYKALEPVDILPSCGKTPRDFAIDPSGNFLLVCNQDSDNLVVFRIDRDTGLFRRLGEYPLPSGVCIVLY